MIEKLIARCLLMVPFFCVLRFILDAPAWGAVGVGLILAYLAIPERPA